MYPLKAILFRNLELFCWCIGLIYLASINPAEAHISICPVKWLSGIDCPGCGLGHSISWLFRGNIIQSMEEHLFGIPTLLIIVFRIGKLINLALQPK